jgi:signal transduction histidine kinase
MKVSANKKSVLGLIVISVIILSSGYVIDRSLTNLGEEQKLVQDTYIVIDKITSTLSLMQDIETGSRGYIITKNQDFLEHYNTAVVNVYTIVKELQDLTSDNPVQQERLSKLEDLIKQKIEYSTGQIELVNTGKTDQAVGSVTNVIGKQLMDEIRQIIKEIENTEYTLLNDRSNEAQMSFSNLSNLSVITSAIIIATVIIVYVILDKGAKVKTKQEQKQQAILTDATAKEQLERTDATAKEQLEYTDAKAVSEKLKGIATAKQQLERTDATAKQQLELTDATAKQQLELTDATAKQQLELTDATAVSEKLKGVAKDEFSAMITHELNTPLVPIIGYCKMFKTSMLGRIDQEQLEAIEVIEKNAKRLETLITDIMDARKLDLDQMKFKIDDLSLDEFFSNLDSDYRKVLENKRCQFTTNPYAKNLVIKTDKSRLRQVFDNLITNAIKFVPENKGKIETGCMKENNNLVFYVKDNGIGILQEKQKELFQKFYQIDTSERRPIGGTGLGLAISKGLVEKLGGTISVKSDGKTGTTFYMKFPLIANSV